MKDDAFKLWNDHSVVILGIAYNIMLACITLVISHFLVKGVHRSIAQANKKMVGLDETIVPILQTSSMIAIYLVASLIILDIFGINTASIITLLGAAGLAIGLALKDTLSNIAAGIVLIVLRPFKVGHFIEFGSTNGTVKEIGLLTTILETPDSLYISAPNSSLWGVPIKNFTRNGTRRLEIVVGISYSDSIDTGFEVFKDIIQYEKRFLVNPAPQMMVQAMADNSVNLQLRAWLLVEDYWTVTWELNKMVKEKFEAAGLVIPFPQRDVHIYNNGIKNA